MGFFLVLSLVINICALGFLSNYVFMLMVYVNLLVIRALVDLCLCMLV